MSIRDFWRGAKGGAKFGADVSTSPGDIFALGVCAFFHGPKVWKMGGAESSIYGCERAGCRVRCREYSDGRIHFYMVSK